MGVKEEGAAVEVDDLRNDLDAAFEQAATDEVQNDGQQAAGDTRPRDEHGRFAPKAKAEAAAPETPAPAPAEQPQAAEQPAPDGSVAQPVEGQQPAQALKAPASWTPEAREVWATVPPAAQAEIARREREHQMFMQETAQARQFVAAFENVVRPFEMFIRAENSNPLQAVENLMVTAARLRTDPPQAKAQLVAGLIQQFGVDLQMLDGILAGQPQPQMQAQPQVLRDPRVDQLLAMQQAQLQQQQQQEKAQIQSGIEAFGSDPKNEFFNDVRGIMADLIEVAARNGQVLDLTNAYNRACRLHDGVSKILDQRAAQANGQVVTQAALRARRAASSVKGDTTLGDGATVPANDSVRAALEAAFDSANNG